jgi:hypothetical protein
MRGDTQSMGNLITKKGKKKESTGTVLNILEAVVKINDPVFRAVGDVITKNDGSTFTVEKPHISCEMEVVDTGPNKKSDIGTTWYERFYYPETEEGSGEYENRPGTKIGNLTTVRYGEGFWEDGDAVLKAGDLEGFTFVCRLKPKTEFGGTKVTGTCVDHDTIEALPGQEKELSDEEEADMEAALGKLKKG